MDIQPNPISMLNLRPRRRIFYNSISALDIPVWTPAQELAMYCSMEALLLCAEVLPDLEMELKAANLLGRNQQKMLAKARTAIDVWERKLFAGQEDLLEYIKKGISPKERNCFLYYHNLGYVHAANLSCNIPRVFAVHFACFELILAHGGFLRVYDVKPYERFACTSAMTAVEAMLDGVSYEANKKIIWTEDEVPNLGMTRAAYVQELAANGMQNWKKWNDEHAHYTMQKRNSIFNK